MLKLIIFQEVVSVNLVLKTTKDMLSDKLVKTAVKMMTTQRKREFLFYKIIYYGFCRGFIK